MALTQGAVALTQGAVALNHSGTHAGACILHNFLAAQLYRIEYGLPVVCTDVNTILK